VYINLNGILCIASLTTHDFENPCLKTDNTGRNEWIVRVGQLTGKAFTRLYRCRFSYQEGRVEFPVLTPPHYYTPVPIQDMDFQSHMSSSFLWVS